MNDEEQFAKECEQQIAEQAKQTDLKKLSNEWIVKTAETKYSYHFSWLGRPVIQFPQDIVAIQQLIWEIQPDLVIETGIARGGSLILSASILELVAQCGGPVDSKVVGIDIDIRAHNKKAILDHPMSKRIEMIEGSSIDPAIIDQVSRLAAQSKNVLIFLDSNHTHEHVLEELLAYGPMVSRGSYIVVFDSVIENMPDNLFADRPWKRGNSPMTATFAYLDRLKEQAKSDESEASPMFEIDHMIEGQLLITVAPNGFLRRI